MSRKKTVINRCLLELIWRPVRSLAPIRSSTNSHAHTPPINGEGHTSHQIKRERVSSRIACLVRKPPMYAFHLCRPKRRSARLLFPLGDLHRYRKYAYTRLSLAPVFLQVVLLTLVLSWMGQSSLYGQYYPWYIHRTTLSLILTGANSRNSLAL